MPVPIAATSRVAAPAANFPPPSSTTAMKYGREKTINSSSHTQANRITGRSPNNMTEQLTMNNQHANRSRRMIW